MNVEPPGKPPQANEYIIMRSKGSPYRFLRAPKEWQKVGEHNAIMLLHDKDRNGYRMVAQAEDGSVVLDCALFAGLDHELRRNFLQWKDGAKIWGVKFGDESVATRFASRFAATVAQIGNAAPSNNGVTPRVISHDSAHGSSNVAATTEGVAALAPQLVSNPRQLFQRSESLAIPRSWPCCCCGQMRNELLLKQVGDDGTIEGGQQLRLEAAAVSKDKPNQRRLCTKCWIENLKCQAGL